VDRFSVSDSVDDYYLLVTRLVGYKRADLAVQAFAQNGKRLVVVGKGPEENALKAMASKNIEFVGWLSDEAIGPVYARCRALVFPGEEDLGIVPLEAQASGRPVIAYGRGGALETVLPDKTGLFFHQQTTEALNEAVEKLENRLDRFEPEAIRKHSEGFGRQRFIDEMRSHIRWCLDDHSAASAATKYSW
jgi:glycosyltransferase involved in cell wall biosynthesis